MHLSRIMIENFRNFSSFDVNVSGNAVVVGENGVGKTNLLHALRLILDPNLSEGARQLDLADFWDGIDEIDLDSKIKIFIEIKEFEDDMNICALLTDFRLDDDPHTVRLNYEFKPISSLEENPSTSNDFEFVCYGGEDVTKVFGHNLRRRLPIDILPALRDAETDLSSWRKSPLRPLIENAFKTIEHDELNEVGEAMDNALSELSELESVQTLEQNISELFTSLSGPTQDIDPKLGLVPTKVSNLHRYIRLLIDGGDRGISDASLGSANLIYLSLKNLELNKLIEENARNYTFLAIEEPEAHLHPHLQRSVYRHTFENLVNNDEEAPLSIFLTTHSPHIASVAPLESLILLKQSSDDGTLGYSLSDADFEEDESEDLSRYLDVTRAEMLFAKGVILVEGDAERFLLPSFAESLDIALDKYGITVCSVSGTNFAPYVKLLCTLDIPFSVITDWDPRGEDTTPLGYNRAKKLIQAVSNIKSLNEDRLTDDLSEVDLCEIAEEYGIFLNDYTLEIDLFNDNFHTEIIETLREVSWGPTRRGYLNQWEDDPDDVDEKKLLKMIDSIGKGRFAQRLASRIEEENPPEYIGNAIRFIYDLVR